MCVRCFMPNHCAVIRYNRLSMGLPYFAFIISYKFVRHPKWCFFNYSAAAGHCLPVWSIV